MTPDPAPQTADGRGLYEWFAASARRHPTAVALEVAGDSRTYAELETLAGHLAAQAVAAADGRPPRRAGLLAARTLTAYAGYLALQRLGATVVPLNPGFPPARNAAVAAAAGLDLVLAQPGADTTGLPAPVLTADAAALPANGAADVPPAHRPDPADTCYILFTSGSTGTPKGVPILHRNVAAYLGHVIGRYELGVGARVSQTFDLTFDLSVFDLFATWGSGATLVVPDANDVLAPVRFVTRERITHWFSVPSVVSFAMRLRGLTPDSMPTLRWSLFCGEPLTAAQAAAWRAAAPGSVLENLYGPTELTLSCTQYRLPPAGTPSGAPAGDTVPIGHLYPGLEQLVVDEDGHPATEGELCVRGVQRFPGYLDPRDNAGRFLRFDGGRATVVQEAQPPADGLWYRTGDRVRQDPRTGLVHLGRLDQQVKVRGYRVELGEIETALRALPGVRDAAVVTVQGPRGDTRLAAACTGDDPDPGRLLTELGALLPPYMVPETLTPYDVFPLNANGKTDRLALREALAPRRRPAR
ncbi:amino acid adenylation domain-containing protein [Streptomyces sp. ISL-11]|uniref:amino acid adenylation domain-containing protein n=1 Tax=Streptomyces sp. ISL-11 TaxID=2819174 RepID=UPI001BE7D4B2|nr:amino acid adenylation domain-containing protein [Streptomyces sp. ISL-11]MBT2383214.1 amino acid adenylation domain-containing protein [Streptomyces sp. ISL-11]